MVAEIVADDDEGAKEQPQLELWHILQIRAQTITIYNISYNPKK